MLHRFQSFEIDESTRELRAGSRVLSLQPLVFDLLVYLVKNHDRVVPKDELLETLWPETTVAESSLQRAVSLARTALAEAGATDVIRTHARHGYRFFAPKPADCAGEDDALGCARDAAKRLEWLDAVAHWEKVEQLDQLSTDDLQCWAHCAQHAGRARDAIAPLERAVAHYRKSGDRLRAGWVALHLAQLRLEWREPIVANGWYQSALRLFEDEPECRERGYLVFLGARMALYSNDLERALELSQIAQKMGGRFHDADLESLGLTYAGTARVLLGQTREGLASLDEAGASLASCDLSPWAGGLVYCGVIFSCLNRSDWKRAGHWTEQFTRWGEDKGTAAYPGLCQMHRAELLGVQGELEEAEKAIRATQELLSRDAPWVEGEAWRVLGEILVAKGYLDEAEQAFAKAAELGWDAQFNLALLRLAEGDAEGAATLLGRTLAENTWSGRSMRGRVLAHYCIAASAAGQVKTARSALASLEKDPDLTSTAALQALTSQARGELAAAEGRPDQAITLLRTALHAWIEMEAPLMAAETRCRLARLLMKEDDRESASLELAAAAAAFRRAGAHGMLSQCVELQSRLCA